WANAMARYCAPQLSVRTRLSPPYRATIRLKVFHGRNSISWAKSVLPVFIGDSRDHPGSLLRLQIVDTAFCSETRDIPRAQSRWPSVNRTAVTRSTYIFEDFTAHGLKQALGFVEGYDRAAAKTEGS